MPWDEIRVLDAVVGEVVVLDVIGVLIFCVLGRIPRFIGVSAQDLSKRRTNGRRRGRAH
jgi:hypothetical protein